MSDKASIVYLAGGGDEVVYVVPEELLNWFDNVKPGERTIPEGLQKMLGPYIDPEADPKFTTPLGETIYVTPGSADNDVALHMSLVVRNFDSESEAESWVYENGMELSNERYVGFIY